MIYLLLTLLLLTGLAVWVLYNPKPTDSAEADSLIELIDQNLPQTQCGECGYAGCRPYAKAISQGQVGINLCPPGGQATIDQLTEILAYPQPQTLSTEERTYHLALIQEDQCIGCTKCIQACPVDAIFGAAKQMHTVLTHRCTGCELCIPPCPVDCIDMVLPSDHDEKFS